MSKINEDFLDEFLKTILTFEKFDDILKKQFPKDITRYIYDFIECKECSKCCKICIYYCNLECLRYNNRNVCCRFELNEQIQKYEEKEEQNNTIEIIDDLIQRNLQNINNNEEYTELTSNDEYTDDSLDI